MACSSFLNKALMKLENRVIIFTKVNIKVAVVPAKMATIVIFFRNIKGLGIKQKWLEMLKIYLIFG